MSRDKVFYGIDLGTTNSCVAAWVSGTHSPVVVNVTGNKKTIPSCVMLKEGKLVVGEEAYAQRWLPNTVYSVKRMMGEDKGIILKEIEIDEENLAKVKDATDVLDVEDVNFTETGERRRVTPIEVSAEILKKLKDITEERGYGVIKDVTITVPAHFNQAQREATVKAGELAGMNVVGVVNEPTSASLAYSTSDDLNSEDIMVYDLGGGTFDISIVSILVNKKKPKSSMGLLDEILAGDIDDSVTATVKANRSDLNLGGDDLDEEIVKLLFKEINKSHEEKTGEKINFIRKCTKDTFEKYKLKVEQAKKSGTEETYEFTVEEVCKDGTEVNCKALLTPTMFDQAIEGIYLKTKELVDDCLRDSGVREVDKIILVGGSTKYEPLRRRIKRDYQTENTDIYTGINPDESVAIGAAVKSKITLASDETDINFADVLALPIGVEVSRDGSAGYFDIIVKKDRILPQMGRKLYTTSVDNQKQLKIAVFQGLGTRVLNTTKIGEIVIDDIPPLPKGEPDIVITMLVNVDGRLSIEVAVGGNKHKAEFHNILGMNTEEEAPTLSKQDLARIDKWKAAVTKNYVEEEDKLEILAELDRYADGEIGLPEMTDIMKDFFRKYKGVSRGQLMEEQKRNKAIVEGVGYKDASIEIEE